MLQIRMFADLTCPFAYLVHATWREIRSEYSDRAQILHRSLALEYVNSEPTPKRVLEAELPVLMLQEPAVPYVPWQAPDSEWPVTVWPAFEAVKCAERQSAALADDLAWSIRTAFFAECRCISMRHILLERAAAIGLDMTRFESDFDSGSCRAEVIEESRMGWDKVPGSPTWLLPDGTEHGDFGLPQIDVAETGRATLLQPGIAPGERSHRMRALLDRLLSPG